MFNFLVVDDMKDSLRSMTRILATGFPQSEIDVAETVKEGLALIYKADKEKKPYHAAILDLLLPYDEGEEQKADTSLCCTIKKMKWPTLVIHWTVHPEDETLKEHLIQFHVGPDDPRAAVIYSLDPAAPAKILSELRAYLYGEQIKNQINSIFDERSGSIMRSKGCMTHDLHALFKNITEYWDYLDDQLQDKIKGLFEVDSQACPICISLVKDIENLGR